MVIRSYLGILGVLSVLALVSCGWPSSSGVVKPYVLDPTFPRPAAVSFEQVSWVAVDWTDGFIYLLQRSLPAVSIWTPEGDLVESWDTLDLGDPHSITLHTDAAGVVDSVWITDMAPPRYAGDGYGHCLKQFSLEGELLRNIGVCGPDSQGAGLDPVQFDKVTDVAFDSQGRLWVADGDIDGLNNRVLKLTPEGEVLMAWSAPDNRAGSGPKELNLPHAVLVDDCDRVWVADALNNRVQVIDTDGTFYGQFACFGDEGVYGLALDATHEADGGRAATLFVSSSSTGGGSGAMHLFDVPMECDRPAEIGACPASLQWEIDLPPTQETAMLHAIAVEESGDSIYIAELGGNLPPQKFVAVSRH